MSTRQPRGFSAILLVLSLGLTSNIGAAEIIGKLSTDQAATVTGQGLEVKLQPGQEYMVFSGDSIQSGAGEGSTVLGIPDTAVIRLSSDSVAGVERSDDRYLLSVERGEVGYELVPGAKVFLVNGEELIDLGQGAGKGGIAVSADGEDGYLVLVDASGGIRVVALTTGALVYEGEAPAELIEAQFGQGASVGFGSLSPGVGGGFMAALTGVGAAALPLTLGAVFAVVAVVDENTTVFRREPDDQPASSPVLQ